MQILRIVARSLNLVLLFTIFIPVLSQANSLDEAKKICDGMSIANKRMASAAGYDIESLCNGLSSLEAGNVEIEEGQPKYISRPTVSSSRDIGGDNQSQFSNEERSNEGEQSIRPFGYDIFANVPSNLTSSVKMLVPSGYTLGPGDELAINLYGKVNQAFSLPINREGAINIPQLGPIIIAGLTLTEAKALLEAKIHSQIIGTEVSISMGSLRPIQIFVFGEAYRPGAYTVPSLATVTQGIISAGGFSDIASLRNIQLKRGEKLIAELDFYDLLLSGNMDKDIRLQDSDVIFIPTVKRTVSVSGEVLRPAIYEILHEETVSGVIDLAGGLTSQAFLKNTKIERVGDDGFMTVLNVDLTSEDGGFTKINNGDAIYVNGVVQDKVDTISILGHVNHESEYQWREHMTLDDIVSTKIQFPPQLDLDYGLIAREEDYLGDLSLLSFKPRDVLDNVSGQSNLLLMPRDRVFFFSRKKTNMNNLDKLSEDEFSKSESFDDHERKDKSSREVILEPILQRLESEASLGSPAKLVEIKGAVKFPHRYPLTPGMSVVNLVEAAGGLKDSAYIGEVEITRQDNSNPEQSMTITISSEVSQTTLLKPHDSVFIKTTPEYLKKDTITLLGEVVFPGEYSFSKGERLSSVIERAGGFTSVADINASVFTREKLREREQQELERLREKLDEELNSQNLAEANSGDRIDADQQKVQEKLIEGLNSAKATGRLVIPLLSIINGAADDVILEPGDVLGVPQVRQEVSVIGEVQRPTSYFFDKNLSYKDYIDQSGGVLQTANKKGIYIVKASGEVIVPGVKLFSSTRSSKKIEPGDTIVVPLDTREKKIEGIKLLSELSQILYQLSLGAAAIDSLKN